MEAGDDIGLRGHPWVKTVPSRDLRAVTRALEQGRARFGVTCPNAVGERRVDARAGHQSGGESATPGGDHPTRVELGEMATGQRTHAVVLGQFWHGQTHTPDRDCGARPETRDRALALCHAPHHASGRHTESRVGSTLEPTRLTRAARTVRVGSLATAT